MPRVDFVRLIMVLSLVASGCGDDSMGDSGLDAPDAEVDGSLPDGSLPDGAIPDGAIPDGAIPDGAIPDGAIPDGATPDGDRPDSDTPDAMADADSGGPGLTIAVNQLPGAEYGISFSGGGARAPTRFAPITGGLIVSSSLANATVETESGDRTEFEETRSRLVRRLTGEAPTLVADYRFADVTRLAPMADGGFAAVATHRRNGGLGDPPTDVLPAGVTGQVVARYDSEGELIWGARFENRTGSVSRPVACAREDECLQIFDIASSDANELYVVGSFEGTVDVDPDEERSQNIGGGGYLAKYGSDGALLWALPFLATPNSVASTPDGLMVAGSFEGTVDFDPSDGSATRTSEGRSDIFFASYTDEGVFQNVTTLGGSLDDSVVPSGLAVRGDVIALSARYQDTFDANPSEEVVMLPDAGRRTGTRNRIVLRFERDDLQFITLGLSPDLGRPGLAPTLVGAQVTVDSEGGVLFAGNDSEFRTTRYGRIDGSGTDWTRTTAERPYAGSGGVTTNESSGVALAGDDVFVAADFGLFANFSTTGRPLLVGRFEGSDTAQQVSTAIVRVDASTGDVLGDEVPAMPLEIPECDTCTEVSDGCPIACFGDEFELARGVVSQERFPVRSVDVGLSPTPTGAQVAWRAEIATDADVFPSAHIVVRDIRDGGALSDAYRLTETPERISYQVLNAYAQQGGGSLVVWSAEGENRGRWVNADASDDETLDLGDDARTSRVGSVGRVDGLYCLELRDPRDDRTGRCITREGTTRSSGPLLDGGTLTAVHDRFAYWRTPNFGAIEDTSVQELDVSMALLSAGSPTVVISGRHPRAEYLGAIGADGMAFLFRSTPLGEIRQPPNLFDVRESPGSVEGDMTRVDPILTDSVVDHVSIATASGRSQALLAWTRRGVAPGVVDQCDVWARIIDSDGEPLAPFRLHDDATGCQFLPHAVASDDGTVTVVWTHTELDADLREFDLQGVILPELLAP